MKGPFIASSDYVKAVSEQVDPWIPGGLFALGTDGMGRSETRRSTAAPLRGGRGMRCPVAALYRLMQEDKS